MHANGIEGSELFYGDGIEEKAGKIELEDESGPSGNLLVILTHLGKSSWKLHMSQSTIV